MGDKPVVNMDPAIARAAVEVAHAQGKPVFAHPQNRTGLDTVIVSEVDVMAHIIPGEPAYNAEQLAHFKAQGTALTPTLALFARFRAGPLWGRGWWIPASANSRHFRRMAASFCLGPMSASPSSMTRRSNTNSMHRTLSERQVLASLTTNPALYFKAAKKGKVEKGFDADLTVLDGDPVADISNLARVAYTIRAGRIIYQK